MVNLLKVLEVFITSEENRKSCGPVQWTADVQWSNIKNHSSVHNLKQSSLTITDKIWMCNGIFIPRKRSLGGILDFLYFYFSVGYLPQDSITNPNKLTMAITKGLPTLGCLVVDMTQVELSFMWREMFERHMLDCSSVYGWVQTLLVYIIIIDILFGQYCSLSKIASAVSGSFVIICYVLLILSMKEN